MSRRSSRTDEGRRSVMSPVEILSREGYKLGHTIGEGSYCKVRIAEKSGQRTAVKIISRQKASTEYWKRFLPRELSILSELDHPNIIRIYRVLETAEIVFIFMDYAERGDLLDCIRRNGRLPEASVRRYFTQLVRAVQYLHSKQITHRDLKCENVLITQDDNIKLTDFGFSRKCVDPETGRRVLSQTFCGSTAYAAPEVLQGMSYNPMMYDVWSLGCILFIMLTGTMPFDDSNLKKMIRHQLEKRFKYPQSVSSEISRECRALIRIPPIKINGVKEWSGLRDGLIKCTKQKPEFYTSGRYINVQSHTTSDYRTASKWLEDRHYTFHFKILDDEKCLRVVVRGLDRCITIPEIQEDLENKGFEMSKLARLRNSRTKEELPLIQVTLP
ncbi:hypothetical protein LAZ67_11002760 [Cordylochernes scorpioides]|uniref:Protein kinase domain-containing protein n=1 Tax=Cordylochernes scorpioides TaxID=51811 RepID=A0ABY6KZG8_9ARAC|nr:hypothetical protein LAZ67_11002760 [Cordylochernes scorpioides]